MAGDVAGEDVTGAAELLRVVGVGVGMGVALLMVESGAVVYWLKRVVVKVRGQIVVDMAMVDVTTATVPRSGQLVIDEAQLVTVTSVYEKTVEVETAG